MRPFMNRLPYMFDAKFRVFFFNTCRIHSYATSSSGKEKHIIINTFAGLSRDWVGGKNLFMCILGGHSLWGR